MATNTYQTYLMTSSDGSTYTKLLDISRNYWLSHGVKDWGIVIEKEALDEGK